VIDNIMLSRVLSEKWALHATLIVKLL